MIEPTGRVGLFVQYHQTWGDIKIKETLFLLFCPMNPEKKEVLRQVILPL